MCTCHNEKFAANSVRRPEGWPPYRDVTNKRAIIIRPVRGVGDAAPYKYGMTLHKFIAFNKAMLRRGQAPPPYYEKKHYTILQVTA